jgi:hypothetical protein
VQLWGLALIGMLLPATAKASCGDFQLLLPGAGLHRQTWQGPSSLESGSPRLTSDSRFHDPIVGMWKVTFIAKGNVGPGLPPDGVVVDNAFAQWHSDGTEIMNSSRNPVTQSFCMGVWKKEDSRRYELNHFAISWDPTTHPDAPEGLANIREDVILSHNGKTFSGTFTIDQYDQSGNLLVHLTGELEGRRITADTPASSVL